MCIGHERRPSRLRRAASAGRRASAQPTVKPLSASAAVTSAVGLTSTQVPVPISYVSRKDVAASQSNADKQMVAPSELQSAQSTSSMSLQPLAPTSPSVLSGVSTLAEQQAAASREGVPSLSAEPSDKALRLPTGGAGSQLPKGSYTLEGHAAHSILTVSQPQWYLPICTQC